MLTMNYNAMLADLEPRWREVFVRAQTYANLNGIDRDFANERLGELFDMLVTAQSEGKPVRRITGGNPERFCRELFSDYNLKERFKALPKFLFRIAYIIFIFSIFDLVCDCKKLSDIWTHTTPMIYYISGICMTFVFELINIFIITPRMLKSKRIARWERTSLFVLVALVIGSVALEMKLGIAESFKARTWMVTAVSGAFALVYLLVRSVWRYKNYGTVFNEKARLEKEIYYHSINDANAEAGILKGWKSRYERLSRKGKVTEESFIALIKKGIERDGKLNKLYYIFFGVVFIASVGANTFDKNQNGDILDLLLFAVTMGLILYGIYTVTAKKSFTINANMKRLIAECEKSGKTLPAFIEKKMGSSWDGEPALSADDT